MKGNFIDNLPKVYGIYTGGFVGFIIIMAIGEQMGMTAKAIGICFVAFTISVSYTHLRAHETPEHLVCRLLL